MHKKSKSQNLENMKKNFENTLKTARNNNNSKNNLMKKLFQVNNNKIKLKKRKELEEQLMFNGRRVIKLKNKRELIDILNNANPLNDESIYYYIENNKEDMNDLLLPNEYFNFNGKKLIKVKGNQIIKNLKNKIPKIPIKKIILQNISKKRNNSSKPNKTKKRINEIIPRKYIPYISIDIGKGSRLDRITRAFAELIPKEREIKKKNLKIKIIQEIKELEKENINLDLTDISKLNITNSFSPNQLRNDYSKKRIKVISINDNNKNNYINKRSNTSREKNLSKNSNNKYIKRGFRKSIKNLKMNYNEELKNNHFILNESGNKSYSTRLISTYGEVDLTKTANEKILKPYELDE